MIQILGETRKILFHIIPNNEEVFHVILGKSALYGFLLDPFKYRENDIPGNIKNSPEKEKNILIVKNYKEQLKKIDEELAEISKHIHIIKTITPRNISSQQELFIQKKGNYFPQFVYHPLEIDPREYLKKIQKIEIPEVPMSDIFSRKKEELIAQLNFLEAFSHQNIENMHYFQNIFWGSITMENLAFARNLITQKYKTKKHSVLLDFPKIKEYVQKFSHIYDIPITCVPKES